MLVPARAGFTEEDYYLGEYTAEERATGLADAALRFANESKSQRGTRAGLDGLEPGSRKGSVNGAADAADESSVKK